MNYGDVQTEFSWGTDQNWVNFIFIPIYQAREKFNNREYETALDMYEHSWNSILLLLLDLSPHDKRADINKELVDKVSNMFEYCNTLLIPSDTPNPNIKVEEDNKKMYELKIMLKRIDMELMHSIWKGGLKLKTQKNLPPELAIKEKFIH
jgi:hypothetical protein